ncbi:histidine kinase [Pseudonocardia sp.]|uniref:histidine kinase n=1 Tax=Pseudonocardia sp. TaxID=60912 RepID=UPI003455AEED
MAAPVGPTRRGVEVRRAERRAGTRAREAARGEERGRRRRHAPDPDPPARRDRIAADLHDQVIQRLFAASLSLRSVAVGLGGGPPARRIQEQIDNLDATIRQIRTTIFDLHASPGGPGFARGSWTSPPRSRMPWASGPPSASRASSRTGCPGTSQRISSRCYGRR